jgi:gliding motility-associated-like protein
MVWTSAGTKHVGLQVIEHGCVSDTLFHDIIVNPYPVASISAIADQCLLGNSFTFGHDAQSNGMDSYAWSLGTDANPVVSAAESPTGVTYNTDGQKYAILQVAQNGCVSAPDTAYFMVKAMPDPQFTISGGVHPGIICSGSLVSVSPSVAPLGPGQFYTWEFQDAIPATATQPNPVPIVHTSAGPKSLKLTTSYLGCSATSIQNIIVNPGLSVTAGPDIEFCEGATGVANAVATGGIPHASGSPYSYIWTSPIGALSMGISNVNIASPTLNPLVTPVAPLGLIEVPYIVYAQDGTGCESNRDTMRVTVYARPRVNAGGNRPFCETGPGVYLNGGLAATNVAVGPFTYAWSPADGMLDNTVLSPYAKPAQTTIYTLMATSPKGCVSDVLDSAATVVVTRKPNPVPYAGPDVAVCAGQSTVLNAYSVGGLSPITYSWSPSPTVAPATGTGPGITPPTVTPLITTEYILTVMADGCPGTDTVLVTVNPLPQLAVRADSSAVCWGESAYLTAESAGNSVVWTDVYNTLNSTTLLKPKATFNVPPLVNTITYSVIATTPQGCVSPKPEQLVVAVKPTPLPFIMQQDTTVCAHAELTLRSDFKWLPGVPTTQKTAMIRWYANPSTQIDSLNKDVTVAPATSTTYRVTTDRMGCAASAMVTITTRPGLGLQARTDTTICAGDDPHLSIIKGGFGDTKFVWTASNAFGTISDPTLPNPMTNPTQSVEYYVTAQEGICSERDTVAVTVKKRPVPTYYASQNTGCAGVEVTFMQNAQDAVAYVWEFGDATPLSNQPQVIHRYNTAGNYTANFTAIAEGGCRATGQPVQILITGGAIADFSSLPSPAAAPIALDNAGVRFQDQSQLMPTGAPIVGYFWDFGDGTTSNEQNPVHAFADSGQFAVKLVITDADGCISDTIYGPYSVFIPSAGVQNVMTPNGDGKNDVFRVTYSGSEKATFAIFDRWGRLVFEANTLTDVWDGKMTGGAEAPAGVYFYVVHIGEKTLKGDVTVIR